MAMCTCRATEHGKLNKMASTDSYVPILRQELGVDPTSTSRYEDTSKDTIWIRTVAESIKKSVTFKRNSKVDPGRMVPFPSLEL